VPAANASAWKTGIAEVANDDVVIRGYRLNELIGRITYIEAVFLILTGELPDAPRQKMLDAMFVSVADHGISPSTVISRILASCGTPLQAAVAGGILSIAEYHGGAGEELAHLLVDSVESAKSSEELAATLRGIVIQRRDDRLPLEGFGHPQHPSGDPRARRLLDIAAELGVAGVYTAALRELEAVVSSERGKPLHVNINGAFAALLLDLGFPWQSIRGFVIAPRTIGLVAHVVEEIAQGNRWRHAANQSVEYTGPSIRTLER
jgi:citrate synthase